MGRCVRSCLVHGLCTAEEEGNGADTPGPRRPRPTPPELVQAPRAGLEFQALLQGSGCGVSRRLVMAQRQMPWLQSQPSPGWCVTSEQVLICCGPQGAAVRSEGRRQHPLCCGQETDGHYLLTLAVVAILRVFLDPHLFYIPEQEQSEPGCWPSPREACSGPSAAAG